MHVSGGVILGYTKLHARVGTSSTLGWAAANRGAHADAEQHETASEGLRAVRARVQVTVAHCGAARGETAIGAYGSVSGAAASCWFALQEGCTTLCGHGHVCVWRAWHCVPGVAPVVSVTTQKYAASMAVAVPLPRCSCVARGSVSQMAPTGSLAATAQHQACLARSSTM